MAYKPVTASSIAAAMPAGYTSKVASVVSVNNNNYDPDTHLVAAVFPGVSNPVDYLTANISSILSGNSDSNTSVSTSFPPPTVAAVIDSVDVPARLVSTGQAEDISPLSVPHIYWRASASVPNDVPAEFECLLNNGSHLVLIRDSLAGKLSLRCHKLPILIEAELAMREGYRKVVVKMYDYVKLHLYDSSCEYTARTVRAIVAPNLIAPVVLGLPFLSHNSIVIDHDACTIIDKGRILT
jgi:hypothetical protein